LRKEQEKKFEEMRKAEEEKARRAKEQEDRIKKEKEELDRKIEAIKDKKLRKMSDLPSEPAATEADTINLAFRLPNGQRLTRRFYQKDKVQVHIFDLVCLRLHLHSEEYWARR